MFCIIVIDIDADKAQRGRVRMKKQAKRMAICGMMTALGVVLMLLGAVLGLGVYVAPMFVGWCLVPIGKEWGKKYQILLWIAISILSFTLVPNAEENLMFAFLFGWYPVLRPRLQKLPRLSRVIAKLLLFNVIVVILEALLVMVLVPESMEVWLALLLLLIGNVTFFFYDFAVPLFEVVSTAYFKKFSR